MAIRLKSSEAQQNFGRVIDQAMVADGVIIERYGQPKAAILSYQRYEQLLQIEAASRQPHLTPPDYSVEAQAQGRALAAEMRLHLQESADRRLSTHDHLAREAG
jgi:prevent-host-death family protein